MKSRISDIINFLSKLSFRKILNYSKLRLSYSLSLFFRQAIIKGLPASLAIEPTTSCNLKCPECPSGLRQFTRKTGNMDLTLYKSIIDQSYKELIYLLIYFQGEPFLHPGFFEMVKYATRKGIYTATSTNAHFLDPENARKTVTSGLDRIIISIDGTTQESYEKYRIGGKLQKVLNGTQNLIQAKKELGSKKPYIIYQFVVFRSNENEIQEIKKLAKKMGVDEVKIKSAQFYNLNSSNDLIPTKTRYLRYQKSENNYALKYKTPNKCWRSWHAPVITVGGKMVPCCFDKDAVHEFGDLKENKLKKVFVGNESKTFKSQILKNRKQFDICRNCTEGIRVFK
ncbi:radical SAM/SPASM domain-containing protein [Bacteroidota bacterium]